MKPVVLPVGRLPGVVEAVAQQLGDLPIQWLGAHDKSEVIIQLDREPGIAIVVIGAGLDDDLRGELVGVIANRRPDLSIHLKDKNSGPKGLVPFARRVIEAHLLAEPA